MDSGQIMSVVVSIVGLIGFYFAGKRVWWSWYINLFCQALWVTFALVTGYLVFLATAAVYSVIFGINAYKWTMDHLVMKRMLENEKAEILHEIETGAVQVLTDEPEESTLVKHARNELNRIGEDPEVIEWYVKVIKEYASFGHSGGSHMAILPVLTKLLDFQPLTALTTNIDEWMYHGEEYWGEAGGIWQNKRDGRCFSKDGGISFTMVDDPKDEQGNKTIYLSQLV